MNGLLTFPLASFGPQLALAAGVLTTLSCGMSGIFSKRLLRGVSFIAVLAALVLAGRTLPFHHGPLIHLDGLGLSWQFLFYIGALPLVLLIGNDDEIPPALLLGSLLGMSLLAVSGNLFMLFIGLEFMSLPAYLLVAKSRGGAKRSLEAAVKYFFAGGTAGALYLLGMTIYYCAEKSFNLTPVPGALAQTGLILMGAAALFKVGAFPLHFWLPDVYEAAAPELSGFLSTSLKSAGVLLLMRLAAIAPSSALCQALPWVGAVTMLFGAVLALRQESLQRLLAYSSMAHAGNLILGVGAWAAQGALPTAAVAVYFYLLAYLFMNNGAFVFLKTSGISTRIGLKGYAAKEPGLCAAFAALLLSLGGVPPTAGFLAKLFIFWEAFQARLYAPLLLAALAALVALTYYLALVRDMYFEAPLAQLEKEPCEESCGRAVVWACAVPAAVLGMAPWILNYLMRMLGA